VTHWPLTALTPLGSDHSLHGLTARTHCTARRTTCWSGTNPTPPWQNDFLEWYKKFELPDITAEDPFDWELSLCEEDGLPIYCNLRSGATQRKPPRLKQGSDVNDMQLHGDAVHAAGRAHGLTARGGDGRGGGAGGELVVAAGPGEEQWEEQWEECATEGEGAAFYYNRCGSLTLTLSLQQVRKPNPNPLPTTGAGA
jgi:hypothetical protein